MHNLLNSSLILQYLFVVGSSAVLLLLGTVGVVLNSVDFPWRSKSGIKSNYLRHSPRRTTELHTRRSQLNPPAWTLLVEPYMNSKVSSSITSIIGQTTFVTFLAMRSRRASNHPGDIGSNQYLHRTE